MRFPHLEQADLARECAPRHRKLSTSVSQSGWGMFLNFLEYKLKHKGGVLVEIDRFFPSSKLCSNCGHKYQDLHLSEREWTCSACGTKHQRDVNAARNIRFEGMRILGLGHSPHGDGLRLQTCSEATVNEVSTTLVA